MFPKLSCAHRLPGDLVRMGIWFCRSGWSLGVLVSSKPQVQWEGSPEEHHCHLLATILIASSDRQEGVCPVWGTTSQALEQFCFSSAFSQPSAVSLSLTSCFYLILPIFISRIMLWHRQFWGHKGQGKPREREELAGTECPGRQEIKVCKIR